MHPSYINSNCNTSFSNMQSIMEASSYNINNKFLAKDDDGGNRSNGHVILENKCLMGKRSVKKDRHSKINTARGPRDRRMRLSIDVAKKFFKLQDMLGFDKASNTIQWLLMKSKPAIEQLNNVSPSSASECEVDLSGIDDLLMEKSINSRNKEKVNSCSGNKRKKRVERGVGNNIVCINNNNSLAKEAREKARARARKRTTEKRNIIKLGSDQYSKLTPSVDQVIDQNKNQLKPWIPFGEDQVRLTDQAEYRNSHLQVKQQIVGDDSSMMMSSNWSPSFLFNYHHTLGPCHEHQFSDLQILGNLWEGNNN
ncbi:hypothetical protein M8C21_031019 [Ambrosia artemisiifolia]|uniref:Uncharacterized protein n=1 Tax=Ambrosia artemisiifolia TaxID=4212 RepID=A0AAD5GKM0_AMBAR|nr:hypothetical protein M8C21_031019 [Ambrosia artemisiifolia]